MILAKFMILRTYLTSARVMSFDNVMTLAKYKAFALSFVQDHGFAYEHAHGYDIAMTMTLP